MDRPSKASVFRTCGQADVNCTIPPRERHKGTGAVLKKGAGTLDDFVDVRRLELGFESKYVIGTGHDWRGL